MRNLTRSVLVLAVSLLLASAITDSFAATATISFNPSTVDAVPVGQTFTVNVEIADSVNLYGWLMNVTFDPNTLGGVKVTEGPFLKNVKETVWPKPVVNNETGFVLASSSLMPPYPASGATGNGVLAEVTFAVKSGGSSSLHFDVRRTYLRTVVEGIVAEMDVIRTDGSYAGGGGGGIGGVPFEILAGAGAAVAVVAVVAGVLLLRRRRGKAEEAVIR